jgi:hypothetical protein
MVRYEKLILTGSLLAGPLIGLLLYLIFGGRS